VFLVGCPRSGTSLLFDLVRRHPDLGSMSVEGHVYWNAFNHPRRHGWTSDRLTAEDCTAREKVYLDTALAAAAGGRRPLDKTPKNVLRIPYLRRHYPEATIVLLVRDGRATVSSLHEGWRKRHAISYRLPAPLELADHRGRLWSYVLPDGWRSLQGSDLATVATHQFVTCATAALEDAPLVDAVVSFEDLVRDPVGEADRLVSLLGLPPSRDVEQAARESPTRPVGSLSPPRPDKWRDNLTALAPHLEVIERHTGSLAALARGR
jgi:hypothetical protein